jgi:hypothetical protein
MSRWIIGLLFAAVSALPPSSPPRATHAEMLDVRANFCDLRDASGRVICTPELPGAPPDVYADWIGRTRAAGATHIVLGPFTPGPWYPAAPWANPDFESDPAALRAFLVRLLDTPSASGKGFTPILFLDGGGRDPKPRIDRVWPKLAAALEGLRDRVIIVPAYEPVEGHWTSAQLSDALTAAKRHFPESVLAYHGSPGRLSGASDPLEPDDPWRGDRAAFYQSHGGEAIEIALYQTEHGRELYDRTSCDADQTSCWRNHWQEYVTRIGAGTHGWRKLSLVLFETVAYEAFRGQSTPDDAKRIANAAKEICDRYGVKCGYGNGLP